MKCPSCFHHLEVIETNEAQIEICGHCQGVFFDFGELSDVARSAQTNISGNFHAIAMGDDKPDHEAHDYDCPGCGEKMEEREYAYNSGIHIDACNSCNGIFLETNELQHISDYLHSLDNSHEAKAKRVEGMMIMSEEDVNYVAWEKKVHQESDNLYKGDDTRVLNWLTEFFIGRA